MQRDKPLKPRWFQILLALADQDRHGLDIMREVSDATNGAMHLWPGTLYGSLRQLTGMGLVREVEMPVDHDVAGGTPRFYRLTSAGRSRLRQEVEQLVKLVDRARIKHVLEGS